jgi:hypothetical protein
MPSQGAVGSVPTPTGQEQHMSFLSFDEKTWDKVRPWTVKKTGVSEAIRAFEKALPKSLTDLKTSADCTTAEALLGTVGEKLEGAKTRLDKNKHEKELKTVSAWISEVALRRKMIAGHSDKLRETYAQQILQANAAMDSFVEKAEEALKAARKLASAVSDQSKEALLAGARGDTNALLVCKNQAAKLKLSFDQLMEDAQRLHPDAEKAVQAKLPAKDLLDAGHLDTIKSLSLRCSNIRVTVHDKIGFYAEQFQESIDTIGSAGASSEGLQEKFAKIIKADLEACEMLIAPVHTGQPGILMDLDQASSRLKAALLQGEPQERTRLLVEAGKWTADAISKTTKFQSLISKLDKALESKTKSYPAFFTEQRDQFKRQHESLEGLRKFGLKATGELNELLQRAKVLGLQIVEAQKK